MSIAERSKLEDSARLGVKSMCLADGSLKARVLDSFWMYVEQDDTAMTPWLLSDGFWEAWVTLWLGKHIHPGSTFIDVGANIGYFTMLAASQGARVLALEPNPRVAALMVRSIEEAGFKDVLVLNQAASNQTQSVILAIPDGHSGGASIVGGDLAGPTVETLAVAIDLTLQSLPHFSSPSVIKIDAEGAEPLIIRGARRCLEANPECLVIFEWDSARFEDADVLLNELRAMGYDLHLILPTGDDEPITNDAIHDSGMQMLLLRRLTLGSTLNLRTDQTQSASLNNDLTLTPTLAMLDEPEANFEYPHGHLWSVRLGFKHVPKCAGISLSLAIHEAWGLQYRGLLQVQHEHQQPISYDDANVAYYRDLDIWRDRSFVAGHLRVSDLKLLNRTFLFTVIRDPVDRSLSAYAYISRMAKSGSTQLRSGELSDEQKHALKSTPFEWLVARQKNQMLVSLLRGGTPNLLASGEVAQWLAGIDNYSDEEIREVIRDCLGQFNIVYLGNDIERIVENLFLQGLLPRRPQVQRMNVAVASEDPPKVNIRKLFDQISDLTRVDQMVVEEASVMFPGYVYADCTPNFDRFSKLAARYGFS